MPRVREGTAWQDPRDGRWIVQFPLADGTRSKPVKLGPEVESRERAKDTARALMMKAAKKGLTRETAEAPVSGETLEAWCARWCADRQARGLTSVDDDKGRLRKWILPVLGAQKPIVSITKRDLERLVEDLDRRVRAGELSAKTAGNAWAVVSKLFDDATNAKSLALRVLATNPAEGVRGPDDSPDKSKVYLYPNELLSLVSCEAVPLRWRRIYAVAVYTFARAGELLALEWSDVDFEGGIIHIHRSQNERGEVKSTKTGETRRVPIEGALVPLLRAMKAEAGGVGRVLTIPTKKAADELRMHCKRAGLARADLYTADATRKPLRFHDLRATGITWQALRGDEAMRIQRRAGHADFATTSLYLREAETVGRDVGTPFPILPLSLLGTDRESLANRLQIEPESPKSLDSQKKVGRGGRDSNPRPPA